MCCFLQVHANIRLMWKTGGGGGGARLCRTILVSGQAERRLGIVGGWGWCIRHIVISVLFRHLSYVNGNMVMLLVAGTKSKLAFCVRERAGGGYLDVACKWWALQLTLHSLLFSPILLFLGRCSFMSACGITNRVIRRLMIFKLRVWYNVGYC